MPHIDHTVTRCWLTQPVATHIETFSAHDARGAIAAAIHHITYGQDRTEDHIVIRYVIRPADTFQELESCLSPN